MDEEKRVCVGAIAGAHGVKGVVRVKPFTAEPEAVTAYAPVTDESGGRTFALRYVGPAKGAILVQIEGVSSREAAEALKGVRLYVPRSSLPEPDKEEFYHADLIGLSVVDAEGAELGTVRSVDDYGAGDILEVELANGRFVMLPFTREVVPDIDLASGRLVAVPPPGLIDGPERETDA